MVPEGGNALYRITPEDGYALKAIYINGIKASYADEAADAKIPQYTFYEGAYEYYFQDVRDIQEIYAEFSKGIDQCEIVVSSSGTEPTVIVTDPEEQYELREGYDYQVGFGEENGEAMLYVTALDEGGYHGVSAHLYNVTDEDARIASAVYDKEENAIVVEVEHSQAIALAAAAYESVNDSDGKMLYYFEHQNVDEESQEPIKIPLEGVQLPEKYNIKVFLLRDMQTVRLLDWKSVVVDTTG